MSLGDLQYLTLLAVARLRDEAVAGRIRELLASVAGRDVSVGTVFVTLTRLEDHGLLASRQGETPARGGRAVRIFSLTEAGREAMRSTRDAAERMWQGVQPG